MRTTGCAWRGTRAATARRRLQRVVPRDAGHRGQRVLSRLSGPERLLGPADKPHAAGYFFPVIRSLATTGENSPACVPTPVPQSPSDSPGALIQRPRSPWVSSACGTEPSCRPGGLHHCLDPVALLPAQPSDGMSYATMTGTRPWLDATLA